MCGKFVPFPKGINAVIFLSHKPVGMGTVDNILKPDDPRVKKFFGLVDDNTYSFKVGFDSCTIPGLVNFTSQIDMTSTDFCEGGRHSVYVDAQMNMMPCSFGNDEPKWRVSLNKMSIEEAWFSAHFEKFRSFFRESCRVCKDRVHCGGYPFVFELAICDRPEKDFKFGDKKKELTK